MQLISGFLMLFFILLVPSAVANAPLILLVLLARTRLPQRAAQILLAAGFGGVTAYLIWRMEWFDMWRHGIPPLRYIVTAFGPYTLTVAAVGWFLGALIVHAPRDRTIRRLQSTRIQDSR